MGEVWDARRSRGAPARADLHECLSHTGGFDGDVGNVWGMAMAFAVALFFFVAAIIAFKQYLTYKQYAKA